MMRKENRKSATVCLAAAVILTCYLAPTADCYRLKKTERRDGRKEADAATTIALHEGKIVFGKDLEKESDVEPQVVTEIGNASMEDDTAYQADFGGWPKGHTYDSTYKEAAWKRMAPSLQCGWDQMKFRAVGPGTSQLALAQGQAPPLPFSHIPPSCGYSMHRNPMTLVMMVPYDGCNVVHEGGSYILPLRWHGTPVLLLCSKPPASTLPTAPPLYPIPQTSLYPPSNPQIPQIPHVPHVPHVPHIPHVPHVPHVPHIPHVPQIPQVPHVPKVPHTSKDQDDSDSKTPLIISFPTRPPYPRYPPVISPDPTVKPDVPKFPQYPNFFPHYPYLPPPHAVTTAAPTTAPAKQMVFDPSLTFPHPGYPPVFQPFPWHFPGIKPGAKPHMPHFPPYVPYVPPYPPVFPPHNPHPQYPSVPKLDVTTVTPTTTQQMDPILPPVYPHPNQHHHNFHPRGFHPYPFIPYPPPPV